MRNQTQKYKYHDAALIRQYKIQQIQQTNPTWTVQINVDQEAL